MEPKLYERNEGVTQMNNPARARVAHRDFFVRSNGSLITHHAIMMHTVTMPFGLQPTENVSNSNKKILLFHVKIPVEYDKKTMDKDNKQEEEKTTSFHSCPIISKH